jgi:hypothetical protein
MNNKLLIPAAVALMGVSAGAWAADDDGAEATIRLMDTAEAELPDAVTKTISLPDHLVLQSKEQAATVDKARGHDKANERIERREQNLLKADKAREHGAEMSENTKDARENQGRAEGRPEPPDRPEDPGRPE